MQHPVGVFDEKRAVETDERLGHPEAPPGSGGEQHTSDSHGVSLRPLVASAGLSHRYVRARPHGATEVRGVLRDRSCLGLIVCTGLVALSLDFFLIGVPVLALERLHLADWVPGAILAVVTVVDGTCGTVAVWLTRRLGRTGAMALGAAMFVVWCGVSALAVVVPEAWRAGWLLGAALWLAAGMVVFSFTVPGVAAPAVVALFAVGEVAPWVVVAVASAVGLVGLRLLAPLFPAEVTLAGVRST